MPSYNRRYKRRRPARRYRRKGNNWIGLAKKAFKTAKWVAGLVNAESKYDDTTSSNTNVDYNGTVVTLCNPAQGTSVNQREGDSIKMQNLTLRGSCYLQGGLTGSVFRMIIYLDKENIITAASDLLQVTGSSASVYSPKFQDTKFQSKVLYDKVFMLDTVNMTQYKFDINLKIDKHVNFTAGSTAIRDGALKMCFISNVTGTVPGVQYYSRVTYLDN